MPDKIIAAQLQIDTGSSNQNIVNTNKALADTGKTLGTVTEGGKTSTSTFNNLKDSLGQIPGPMKGVADGAGVVNTALKTLAANPLILVLTLIVGALYGLYKAFTSTEEGAEKVEQIFSGLSAIVTVIRDRILKFGSAILDFFKGNFKQAMNEAKESVSGVGDEIVTAYNKAADATKRLQEAEDELNRVISVGRAKLERDLAASKELITDETASYQDRRKAIDQVRVAEGQQSAAELTNAQKTLKALQDKLDLDKQSADARDAVAQQEIKVYNIQEQNAADLRNLNKQSHQIEAQENQKATEAYQKELEKRKQAAADFAQYEQQITKLRQENYLSSITDTYQKALAEIQINLDNELDAVNKSLQAQKISREQAGELQLEIDRKYHNQLLAERDKHDKELLQQQTDADKKAADARLQKLNQSEAAMLKGVADYTAKYKIQQDLQLKIDQLAADKRKAILNTAANVLGSFANLVGKQTVVGKALAIAQTTIDTYQSAISSYKSLAGIPVIGPALGFAAAAAAIANGIASVKQIVSVKVPGAADSSSTAPAASSIAQSAPVSPQQAGTSIDQTSIQGIGNAVAGRSYVLSQDVSHDMDRNERLNRSARLGG
jgi:hypothetical protein